MGLDLLLDHLEAAGDLLFRRAAHRADLLECARHRFVIAGNVETGGQDRDGRAAANHLVLLYIEEYVLSR